MFYQKGSFHQLFTLTYQSLKLEIAQAKDKTNYENA